MRRARIATAVLVLAVAVAGAVALLPRGERTCVEALVPLYAAPADESWDRLAAAGAADRITIVVNPANGPGPERREDYARRIADARARGTRVLGYVPTAYGARPPDAVRADVDAYERWYEVDGVFFDEAAAGPGLVPYYRDAAAPIRSRGRTAVLNPGLVPDAGYLEVADAVVVFEGEQAVHADAAFPGWTRDAGARRIAHLVHTAQPGDTLAVLRTAAERGAGLAYVTDDTGANPWDVLAATFARDAAELGQCAVPS